MCMYIYNIIIHVFRVKQDTRIISVILGTHVTVRVRSFRVDKTSSPSDNYNNNNNNNNNNNINNNGN